MICYVLAMEKQHLGPHVVVGYGIKIFWPGLFITSPDHLAITNIFRYSAKPEMRQFPWQQLFIKIHNISVFLLGFRRIL